MAQQRARMIHNKYVRRATPALAVAFGSAVLALGPSTPANAGTGWSEADLTAVTGAPNAVTGKVCGYTSNLSGQGQAARVVYRSSNGHIHELSVVAGQGWHEADLTAMAGATLAVGDPSCYATNLTGQGGAARVVYRSGDGHIHELSIVGVGGSWQHADLTATTGAVGAVSDPSGYTTSLSGQGGAARVVYRSSDGHIRELSIVGVGGTWQQADLTAATGGALAAGDPSGYPTFLSGQGAAARVVYRSSGDGHIRELSIVGVGGTWQHADLTATAGAALAVGDPSGYSTSLSGQGAAARVVYRSSDGHIRELSIVGVGGTWQHADLSAATGAVSAVNDPSGYTTNLAGQGAAARVVYRGSDGHIRELSIVGVGGTWQHADLTSLAGAPSGATAAPTGYTTSLTGQGPVARVVYVRSNLHIEELSVG